MNVLSSYRAGAQREGSLHATAKRHRPQHGAGTSSRGKQDRWGPSAAGTVLDSDGYASRAATLVLRRSGLALPDGKSWLRGGSEPYSAGGDTKARSLVRVFQRRRAPSSCGDNGAFTRCGPCRALALQSAGSIIVVGERNSSRLDPDDLPRVRRFSA